MRRPRAEARRAGSGAALRAALTAVFLFLLPALAAGASNDLPALTGRVVDDAGLIDPATKAAMTKKLADYEAKSSDQVVVATVPSLGGEAIEPYANRLFRAWKLGQAHEDNGVLLLVSKKDRKVRIEVGYGLEGVLTDAQSKLIIVNDILPAFRRGDFAGGLSQGVDDIVSVLSGDAADLNARAARNAKTRAAHNGGFFDNISFVIFALIWGFVFFGGFGLAIIGPIFGRRIGPGRYMLFGLIIDRYAGRSSRGWSSGGGGGFGGGGFSGGGGSSGGGGASGGW